MRILPVSNNNLYVQKRQNNPNFGARIDKTLVQQMKGKNSPLKELALKSSFGITSLPAAIVAIMSLKTENKKEVKEETASSSEMLYKTVIEQDPAYGETILHNQLSSELMDILHTKLSTDQFVHAFTIKSKFGYQPLSDKTPVLKSKMMTIINHDNMPLESAVKIIDGNELGENFNNFLSYRLEKEKQMNKPVNNHINYEIYDILRENNSVKVLDVETKEEVFYNLPVKCAAKLFKTDKDVKTLAQIDSDYLPYASAEEIQMLTLSAQEGSEYAFTEVCEAVKSLPEKEQAPVVDKIIDSIDPESFCFHYHTEAVLENFGQETLDRFHQKQDSKGNTIMHWAAANGDVDSDDFEYSDFVAHFNQLKSSNPELLKELMLTKNINGDIPADLHDCALRYVVNQYKDEPEMVKKIYMNQDIDGCTILHVTQNQDIVKDAFDTLSNEDLADVLTIKDNEAKTALAFQKDNKIGSMLNDKVVELATNSDLSIDKSIDILQENDIEPQLVEFLEFQKSAQA